MSKILFIFPGQGAQYTGIGSDLIQAFQVAKEAYELASSVLGYDMIALSSVETGNNINQTRYTQPVLLTHSYACMQVFLQQTENKVLPSFACGHSLGEYGALVAADSLNFESALSLVSTRGECMGEFGGGEMLALPLSEEQLNPLVESSPCEIAACNLPEQTVVGGWPADLDHLVSKIEKVFPGKTGTRLKTEGAFHTSQMLPAAEKFEAVLNEVDIELPKIPVAANVTGGFHESDVDMIRSNLYLQLFKPVRWYANLMAIADIGVDTVIEFGGGLGSGNNPADKRPNLAAAVARAYRRSKPRPEYHSVINLSTLESTLNKVCQ